MAMKFKALTVVLHGVVGPVLLCRYGSSLEGTRWRFLSLTDPSVAVAEEYRQIEIHMRSLGFAR
jgi:hypothetical protein